MMQTKPHNMTLSRLVILLLVGWWVLTAYTFFHESGHALAAAAFGGRLTSFDIDFWDFTAHSAIIGHFSTMQQSILALAGMALPYTIWSLCLLLMPSKRPLLAEVLLILSSLGVISTFIPWVVLSILHVYGGAPSGDDVTHFLNYSGLNGYTAAAAFTLIMLFSAVVFWRKSGGLPTLRRVLLLASQDDSPWHNWAAALIMLLTWFAFIWLGEKF
jgi:hypothetical protein